MHYGVAVNVRFDVLPRLKKKLVLDMDISRHAKAKRFEMSVRKVLVKAVN